jgi:anti-sigma regulatory factor (Ser/Thr protein kinase)
MDQDNVLTVGGRYDQIRKITSFVTSGARGAGLDDDAVFHIELCCDEAASNIIEHAYGGEELGEIVVHYWVDDDAFIVTLSDQGRPFNPDEVPEPQSINNEIDAPEPALAEYLDSLQVGGLGIYFMRKLMDEVHYSFNSPSGNRLTLVKYLPARSDL